MEPLVVMGVSGAGKSVVGATLAARLNRAFLDADTLHSDANVAKMRAGIPLEDADRWPWLDAVAASLGSHPAPVVACSALRVAYRDRIREVAPETRFVLLSLGRASLAERLAAREAHFMPLSLLDSQLSTLEPLEATELGVTVNAELELDAVVTEICKAIGVD